MFHKPPGVVQIYSVPILTTIISMATKVERAGDCLGLCLWAERSTVLCILLTASCLRMPQSPTSLSEFPKHIWCFLAYVTPSHTAWVSSVSCCQLLYPEDSHVSIKIDVKSAPQTAFLIHSFKRAGGQSLKLKCPLSPVSWRLSLQMQQSLEMGCFGSEWILRSLTILTDNPLIDC